MTDTQPDEDQAVDFVRAGLDRARQRQQDAARRLFGQPSDEELQRLVQATSPPDDAA